MGMSLHFVHVFDTLTTDYVKGNKSNEVLKVNKALQLQPSHYRSCAVQPAMAVGLTGAGATFFLSH